MALSRTHTEVQALAIKVDDVEGQLNRRIETARRELGEQRYYFEALLREKERAVDIANGERDRTTSALRAGQEKAVADNYDRLHEQIVASEKLLSEMVNATINEFRLSQESAEKALVRASEAQQRVNEKQNEFRQALEDQAKRTERDMMPRREFDVQHTALMREATRNRDDIGAIRLEMIDRRTFDEYIKAADVRYNQTTNAANARISEVIEGLSRLRTDVAVGPKTLKQLEQSAAAREGKEVGAGQVLAYVFQAITFIIAIGAVIAIFATH